MTATFRADYAGIGQMLNSPFMREAMQVRAEEIKAVAVADADTYADTGEFASKFEVDSGTHGGVKNDRAWATVTNTDPNALSIEFGHFTRVEDGTIDGAPGEYVEGHYSLSRAAGTVE